VRVQLYGDDPFVLLSCLGDDGVGEAWARVRVAGVQGHVNRVGAAMTGDCRPRDLRWRKRGSAVLVTISLTADTDCQIRTVHVRSD